MHSSARYVKGRSPVAAPCDRICIGTAVSVPYAAAKVEATRRYERHHIAFDTFADHCLRRFAVCLAASASGKSAQFHGIGTSALYTLTTDTGGIGYTSGLGYITIYYSFTLSLSDTSSLSKDGSGANLIAGFSKVESHKKRVNRITGANKGTETKETSPLSPFPPVSPLPADSSFVS
jgi:hypothetical protein